MKIPSPPNASQNEMIASLFRAAARFEPMIPAAGLKNPVPGPEHSRFAELVAQPEKLEEALKAARAENEAFAASRTVRNDTPRPTGIAPPKNGGGRKSNPAREIRKVEISLAAPTAKSVKLAADFTDWEKCPLELTPSAAGVWSGVIPLEPGEYCYRFIVDGQWCDDPRSTRRVRNPFGTEDALLVVL